MVKWIRNYVMYSLVALLAIYSGFAFCSMLYAWDLAQANPGMWHPDARGAAAMMFVVVEVVIAMVNIHE